MKSKLNIVSLLALGLAIGCSHGVIYPPEAVDTPAQQLVYTAPQAEWMTENPIDVLTHSLHVQAWLRDQHRKELPVDALIAVIREAPTPEARSQATRLLERRADSASIPALLKLADIESTSASAITILQAMPWDVSSSPLLELLSSSVRAETALMAGHVLGLRQNESALPLFVERAGRHDGLVSASFLQLIENYTSDSALAALLSMDVPASSTEKSSAYLSTLAAVADRAPSGLPVLRRLLEQDDGGVHSGWALLSLARRDPSSIVGHVTHGVLNAEHRHHKVSLQALAFMGQIMDMQPFVDGFELMEGNARAAVLRAFAVQADARLTHALAAALDRGESISREACVAYFSAQPLATAAPMLLLLAAQDPADQLAIDKLATIESDDLDALLSGLLDHEWIDESSSFSFSIAFEHGLEAVKAQVQPVAIQVVGLRRVQGATEALFRFAGSEERNRRNAALTALGRMVTGDNIDRMLDMVESLPSNARSSAIDSAAVALQRLDSEVAATAITRRFDSASSVGVKGAWLSLASKTGGDATLNLLLATLEEEAADLRRAALRALGDWVGPEPLDALIVFLESRETEAERLLAARSALNILERLATEQKEVLLPNLTRLVEATENVEVRRRVLSVLPLTYDVDAMSLAYQLTQDSNVRPEAIVASAHLAQLTQTLDREQALAGLERVYRQLLDDEPGRRQFFQMARNLLPIWAVESWTPDPHSGFWEGELAFRGNSTKAVALVNATDFGVYRVQIREKFDGPYHVLAYLDGQESGQGLSISGFDWVGKIEGGVMVGAIPGDESSSFHFVKTDRQSPSLGRPAPDGAVVLFDGTDFSQWHGTGPDGSVTWQLVDGAAEVLPKRGSISTFKQLEDFELHLEFRSPYSPGNPHQFYGNSGVFFQFAYEVQVLNSFARDPRMDDCAAIYGFRQPDLNASFPPTVWQTYDIVYRSPRLAEDGSLVRAGMLTVLHNGVPVHQRVELTSTSFEGVAHPNGPQSLHLQDHHNRVQYRNIWVRDLHSDLEIEAAVDRLLSKEYLQ